MYLFAIYFTRHCTAVSTNYQPTKIDEHYEHSTTLDKLKKKITFNFRFSLSSSLSSFAWWWQSSDETDDTPATSRNIKFSSTKQQHTKAKWNKSWCSENLQGETIWHVSSSQSPSHFPCFFYMINCKWRSLGNSFTFSHSETVGRCDDDDSKKYK